MSTAIDSAGRIVIPKAVREAAGIRPGVPLEVRYQDGSIVIEPTPLQVSIKDTGGVAVAHAVQPVPMLAADTVNATRDRVRDERG